MRALAFAKTYRALRRFRSAKDGAVAVIFGVLLLPMVGAIGAAVDYGKASSMRAAIQAALDATALSMIKDIASYSTEKLTSTANSRFQANFSHPAASNVQVTAIYASEVLVLTATAKSPTSFMGLVGIHDVPLTIESASSLGGSETWPVCVLITHPTDGHTLKVEGESNINFTDCMIQVNTQNWDAVEARDTSYIHSTKGVHCFTGDIHYGDVKPPKEPTCTMLPDPYASYTIPTPAACTSGNTGIRVQTPTTLSAGTYCDGLQIEAATTFSPGVYIIQGGLLQIKADVVATGVTFILTGKDAGFSIDVVGKVKMSPATTGTFAGFQFFLDQSSNFKSESKISQATVTMSGVVYLKGQKLTIQKSASVTVSPGSLIAHYLLPSDKSKVVLNGSMSTSTVAEKLMRKSIEKKRPILLPPGQAKKS